MICLLLALLGIVMRKTYFYLPIKELKRRAIAHEHVAERIYEAASYGNSLRALLWLQISLAGGLSLVLLSRQMPLWAGLLVVGPLLWLAFSFIPATRVTRLGAQLTVWMTPVLVTILHWTHPLTSRLAQRVQHRYLDKPSRLFEREDLLELIQRQNLHPENRLSKRQLELAAQALEFEERTVGDVMTGRKKFKTVLADDTIGPVLIDELHKAGRDIALVREAKKGPIVGTLDYRQLNLKSRGKVSDLMDSRVYYLHQSDSLSEAVGTVFATGQTVFFVVNDFEEHVGMITLRDMLRKLFGGEHDSQPIDHTDPAAVAARHSTAKKSGETESEMLE